jgi:DUF4097 and DUF4098 domain-containing protein YvlB
LTGFVSAQTFERQFDVRSGGEIEFDLDAGGSINLVGWNRESVSIVAEVSGDDADIVSVTMEQIGNKVLVKSDFTERRRHKTCYIEMTAHVPSIFNLEFKSQGGGVSIEGVEGEFRGKTNGGELVFNQVKGKLQMTTMGGQIRLTNSDCDGRVKTMGGKALVEDVFGDVVVTSMGGPVIHRRVTRSDGTSTGDQVRISSKGGSIDVPEAPAGADVHTMGGDITIASASDFVRAKTMGGDILIEQVDGRVTATTMAGDVDVTVTSSASSGADINLTSMFGEITLTVPSGFGMDIHVELAYTKNSSRSYEIKSDFPVSQEESREWEYGNGSPRKVIRGNAVVNGGGNRVILKNVNGNVRIRQSR